VAYNPLVDVSEARELARGLLADNLPQRWDHSRGVASRAELFVGSHPRANLLIAAGYLHDIGYAAEAIDTGFHQIDGARFLRRLGYDEEIVNMVAHHSGAAKRAPLFGFDHLLETEFPMREELPHRELHFCDLTTGLDGQPVSCEDRLADLRHRHRDNPPMLRFLDENEADLRHLVQMIQRQLIIAA